MFILLKIIISISLANEGDHFWELFLAPLHGLLELFVAGVLPRRMIELFISVDVVYFSGVLRHTIMNNK